MRNAVGIDLEKKLQRSMSQGDEKLVGSSQVAEQEVAIEEDNAPSQGYPLSVIESRKITGRSRMLTHTCYVHLSMRFSTLKEKCEK